MLRLSERQLNKIDKTKRGRQIYTNNRVILHNLLARMFLASDVTPNTANRRMVATSFICPIIKEMPTIVILRYKLVEPTFKFGCKLLFKSRLFSFH